MPLVPSMTSERTVPRGSIGHTLVSGGAAAAPTSPGTAIRVGSAQYYYQYNIITYAEATDFPGAAEAAGAWGFGTQGEGLPGDSVGGPLHADIPDTIGLTFEPLDDEHPRLTTIIMPPGWMWWQTTEVVIFTTNGTFVVVDDPPPPHDVINFSNDIGAGTVWIMDGGPPTEAQPFRTTGDPVVLLISDTLTNDNPEVVGQYQELTSTNFGYSGPTVQKLGWGDIDAVNRADVNDYVLPSSTRVTFSAVRVASDQAQFNQTVS